MASGCTTQATEGAPAAPRRLVIVDDDAGIRMLLEVTISLDPRFVLAGSAATGAECMRLLRSDEGCSDVDVVLLDVTLPDFDGIELLSEVRSVVGDARVALFTGWSDEATLDRAREAGADAVFAKDGEPRRLLDGLAELCSS